MGGHLTTTRVTATGTAMAQPSRLAGFALTPAAAAGLLVLRDGGSGGTVRLQIACTAAAPAELFFADGSRLAFNVDVHATISGVGAEAQLYFG